MNYRNTSVQDAPTNIPNPSDSPPSYSECISNPMPVSSNNSSWEQLNTTHHSRSKKTGAITVNPMSEHNGSETSSLNGIHDHDIVPAASAPFLDVAPGSENLNDGYNPRLNISNTLPAYNPTFTTERQITPRPNVYERRTIVLQRNSGEMSTRKRRLCIFLWCVIVFGIFFGAVIFILCQTLPINREKSEDTYKPVFKYDLTFDRQISEDPYVTDTGKNQLFEEEREEPPKIDAETQMSRKDETIKYPSLEDTYNNLFEHKSRQTENPDDTALRALGLDPDKFQDILNNLKKPYELPDESIYRTSIMNDRVKEILGIPRLPSTSDDATKEPAFPWE